jgi:acylphosphatase
MTRNTVSLRIEGRVQGVGYRWWTAETARRLGLEGWVRNRADGSVEILAMGERAAIQDLARACGDGPPGASVLTVKVEPAEDDGSVGFEPRGTV